MKAQRFRSAFTILAVFAAGFVPTFATAETDPVFHIENILVRGTGSGSAEARARAFELAHIAGLRTIVDRLTTSSDRFSLRLPQLEELTSLVEEINVRDQRLSETTLVALMDMKFSKPKVKAFLAEEGLSFTLTKAQPMIVIPVLEFNGNTFAWDDRSPWFRIWQKEVLPSSLIEFQFPKSEADFKRLLDLANSGSGVEIEIELKKEKAGALLFLVADLKNDEAGNLTSLTVNSERFGSRIGPKRDTYSVPIEQGETPEEFLANAAREIAKTYNEAWKNQSSTQIADEIAELEFSTQLEGLDGWLALDAKLNEIGLIERVDLLDLTDTNVKASLRFNGTLDQLIAVLSTQGLDLIPAVDEFLLITQ